ncbi:hypothetical protein V6N12_037100 [Hibiscus sabdariffa]|uniref:Uncharacterized protein n=2 Tax=Hibiscus sabdariffa TaxID=183260 RepID=A0ABR2ANV4_9ROSI
MTNSDEINTSIEAVVNNSHGTANNNVNESSRSNQNTAANTFVSPQANAVFANTAFASSPVYYASTPHTVALPQGFNSSSPPSAHSIV